MRHRRKAALVAIVDLSEWTELAARLAAADPRRHAKLLDALRTVVAKTEALELLEWSWSAAQN
jgi:hypothetical protein